MLPIGGVLDCLPVGHASTVAATSLIASPYATTIQRCPHRSEGDRPTDYGIFGGLTAEERRQLRSKRRAA